MLEKLGTIKNPLTIIAMFAGLAEISGTVILPFISGVNQNTFIWFLMFFPVILVILFFLTLNLNHKVLYAPSDFKDENNFLLGLQPATSKEKVKELREQSNELKVIKEKHAELQVDNIIIGQSIQTTIKDSEKYESRKFLANSALAEKLILVKVQQELEGLLVKDMTMKTVDGKNTLFNAVVQSEDEITGIKIIFLPDPKYFNEGIAKMFQEVSLLFKSLPVHFERYFTLYIVLASESKIKNQENLSEQFSSMFVNERLQIKVKFRMFNIEDLEKELEVINS